ncbi:MAG: hypothetical protein M1450_04395 [Patescibacteria group bacterium]|nr:hypothetical protein [Patescibacteria group bacterium]
MDINPFNFFTDSIIRLIIPLIIFKFPLLGVLISMYIDGQDWHFLDLQTQSQREFYRIWDKIADLYYLSLAFITTFFWKDKIAKEIGKYTFALRLLGVILFIIFNQSFFLFLFPNFFEVYFIFYLVYRFFSKQDILFHSAKEIIIVVSVVLIPRLFAEYVFHVQKLSPFSDLIRIGSFFSSNPQIISLINSAGFLLLYLATSIIAMIWLVRKYK